MLEIVYGEEQHDRWIPLDRFPRRIVRRILRGPEQPSGTARWFLNLLDGLRRCGIAHRENAIRSLLQNPETVVGIIGREHMLRKYRWRNPVVFGPAVFSHPSADPEIFRRGPIRKVLVSCDWMQRMYQPEVNLPVNVWAAGIDTYSWRPDPNVERDIDILIYDKVRWHRDRYESELIQPIHSALQKRSLRLATLRYGSYLEDDYKRLLQRCRAMLFLVEHETQGFAYLQALASGVPILAWDAGGYWTDPAFFPHRVQFEGVTSVPYWDARCGAKFSGAVDFEDSLDAFLVQLDTEAFSPRDYIVENLTLEQCARRYAEEMTL